MIFGDLRKAGFVL